MILVEKIGFIKKLRQLRFKSQGDNKNKISRVNYVTMELSRINDVKVNDNLLVGRDELAVGNPGHVEQLLARNRLRLFSVFVRKINDLNNPGLNDHLCTFVAWEEGNVDTTILNGR